MPNYRIVGRGNTNLFLCMPDAHSYQAFAYIYIYISGITSQTRFSIYLMEKREYWQENKK